MVVFFERNAVFGAGDVRMFLQRKKFSVRASATGVRRSQRVVRHRVTKQMGERVLHSCCNAVSEC